MWRKASPCAVTLGLGIMTSKHLVYLGETISRKII